MDRASEQQPVAPASSASPRVTRSSARLAADTSSVTSDEPSITTPLAPPANIRPSTSSRKRKATQPDLTTPEDSVTSRKSKKSRITSTDPDPLTTITSTISRPKRGSKSTPAIAAPPPAMSSGFDDGEITRRQSSSRRRQPSPPGTSTETSPQSLMPSSSSRRRSSRKKFDQGPAISTSTTPVPRKSKKGQAEKDHTASMDDADSQDPEDELMGDRDEDDEAEREEQDDKSEEEEETARREREEDERMDEDDPFSTNFLRGGPSGLSNTLRALSGMMSGMTTRMRGILENLRVKDDPSMQHIALTELSEILLISNEDNLAGHFSPDAFVKELVPLMQPNDFGEENPEMMLLACRCIANLMEAVPSTTASVVYGGAVPVLCQKLLEIHFIDLAEQALSTLEKISVEFPASIVREGGLTACLTYLDFFATSTQRTAVTTAANCCRNIPEDSFPVVRDVMPILLNVLSSNDQRVVEQGSLCVCRVIQSFRWQESKLEELVSPDLLKAIIRLLLPGSTNMIGANIHTQFLQILAIISRASPRLSVELLRMNVVETLYQILTGVSPPTGLDDMASKIDKNIIMQALIRSPKDQIFETLNVICELLPSVHRDNLMFLDDLEDGAYTGAGSASMSTRARKSPNDKRLTMLSDCTEEVRRFAIILFPTLMHAYTSTVNLSVRQKVLTAQLKMLSNFETPVIEDALRGVPYASHLASIMSQEENPMLVTFALQICELLLKRLGGLYKSQFYREGVMAEISRLASRKVQQKDQVAKPKESQAAPKDPEKAVGLQDESREEQDAGPTQKAIGEDNDEDDDDEDHEIEHGEEDEDDEDEESDDPDDLPRRGQDSLVSDVQDMITQRALRFTETYGASEEGESIDATQAVKDLRKIAQELRDTYSQDKAKGGVNLYEQLSTYFTNDALAGITSYELLTSGIVDTLLEVFSAGIARSGFQARSAFLEAFMSGSRHSKSATGDVAASAFSVLVQKLQDLLSRTEHFEVITVHHNAFESNRSSAASMLAKQLRLKLVADDDSGIPTGYRNIMVSIHAIATFRALDDYLRPRISLAERPRRVGNRDAMLGDLLGSISGSTPGGVAKTSKPATPAASAPENALPVPKTRSSKPTATDKETPSNQLRRSSRRLSSKTGDVHTPSQSESRRTSQDGQSPLECADEAHLEDGAEVDDEEMDTIVDDFEEELDDEEEDPSAVNMELGNSGKVTARKEDGTRVNTPLHGSQAAPTDALSKLSASARLAAARELLSTPPSLSRPMSYASALQATPQDWHIEFSVNGQPIANDTTIYRAVHFNQSNPEEVSGRLIWSALHKITFKRVAGPPPVESSALTPPPEVHPLTSSGLPPSLTQHPQTAMILKLMSILHSMNDNLEDVVSLTDSNIQLSPEPLAQFVNTKLTAKLNRQMEEPLIVASNCLPSWAEDLARLYPFLFPFETRHLFLQSTSFGYSRSMTKWQAGQPENESRRHRDERPFLGRTQRQKVRISRMKIIESALKVMELYGSSPSILEVEYFEEVGTGLGPTLEFYSTVSREFSKKKLKLWRENESEPKAQFAFGKRGLFPAPMSEEQIESETGKRVLHLFRLLGKFVARSMLDSRIIDIPFNPTFFRVGDGFDGISPSLGAVSVVDQGLANSLKDLMQAIHAKRDIDDDSSMSASDKENAYKKIDIKGAAVEDLGLDFTLPGYPSIELQANGANTDVTIYNVEQYVNLVIDLTLGSGVRRQIESFQTGFSQVFPYSAIKAFTPDELVMLFGQAKEDWSLETLMDSIKADHGFNLDSQTVRNLLHIMSEYNETDRRDFLQFVSGSPKLPIGGFKSLTPMFTVVCKPAEPPLTSDEYLPSVMTCVNYLKLPDYSTMEVLKAKLAMATKEGQGAFHLS